MNVAYFTIYRICIINLRGEYFLKREEINIEYTSQLNNSDFSSQLQEVSRKDSRVGYTTVGIHKDDMIFQINGNQIKNIEYQFNIS